MYIKVKVTPEARLNSVKRLSSEKYQIQVKDASRHNLANKRALSLLAQHLNVPAANLRIISGHQRPHKIIHIRQ